MKTTKEEPKKAVRDLDLKLEFELHSYDNTIEIKIGDAESSSDDYVKYTEKQLRNIAEQIVEKMKNSKVTLLAAIMCPNCKNQIDETGVKGKYHCGDCNITVKMEFGK